ncbi:Myomesin-1, partial [Geodia barretti]
VASDPFNITLTQTSATSVIVEWSQPSGGATVTGYVVHYSHGVDNINQRVAASSTSSNITHLDRNTSYQFSVEATSEHVSGESNNCTITLFDPFDGINVVECDPVPQSQTVLLSKWALLMLV